MVQSKLLSVCMLSQVHTHIRLGDINFTLYGCNAFWVLVLLAVLNLSDFGEFKETCEGTDGFDNCTTLKCRSHMLIKFVSLLEKTNPKVSRSVTFQGMLVPKIELRARGHV